MTDFRRADAVDVREFAASHFRRSRTWLYLQATRRLSRRILASVPVIAKAADRVSHRSWKPPGDEGYLRLFAKYWGHFRASGLDIDRATVCEIGPGRTLDVSLMFALLGAKRVIAVDCERWASVEETVSGALRIAEEIPAYIECTEQETAEIRRRAVNGDYELVYENWAAPRTSRCPREVWISCSPTLCCSTWATSTAPSKACLGCSPPQESLSTISISKTMGCRDRRIPS